MCVTYRLAIFMLRCLLPYCWALILACGLCPEAQGQTPNLPTGPTPALRNTHLLQGALQRSNRAIFMLRDGTAAFVRYKNHVWVMTNNHVVGLGSCSAEGCWAPAALDFEAGKAPRHVLMHLTPAAARDDVDLSLFRYRVFALSGKPLSFQPPATLTFAPPSRSTYLPGSPVTVIGHPRSGLKKFSQGTIRREHLGYLMVDALTLPGSSGSPLLNGRGEIIGIHHSSSKRNDMWTARGLLYQGRGSSLTAIRRVLSEALQRSSSKFSRSASAFVSLRSPVSFAQAQKLSRIFQAAGTIPKLTQGGFFFDELYRHCLPKLHLRAATLHSYRKSHHSCTVAQQWLRCPAEHASTTNLAEVVLSQNLPRSHATGLWTTRQEAVHYYCPSGPKERLKWLQLMRKVGQGYRRFVGADPLQWSFDATLSLAESPHSLLRTLTFALREERRHNPGHRTLWHPQHLHRIAQLTQRFPAAAHHALVRKAAHHLLQYQNIQDYAFHLPALARAAHHFGQKGLITPTQLQDLLSRMKNDPELTLWAQLAVERVHYESTVQQSSQHKGLKQKAAAKRPTTKTPLPT